MDKISVIVPCYNEEACVLLFYNALMAVMREKLPETDCEVIYIDDGSRDGTLSAVKELCRKDERVRYVSFSRNFGKESAIYAGLRSASGDYAVLMDADLQDPPELLPKLYRAVKSGEYDSAATRRVTRKGEPPIRSFFARRFYHLMNRISRTELVDGARDYRLMNRKFVDALLSLAEYNRFSKGLFGWVGFRTKWIEFENVERAAGETKWSFWSLFKYSVEGIVAFSTAPLMVASFSGIVFFTVAFLAMIFIIVRRLVFGDPVSGWASTVTIILFLGGIQLLSIGVLGIYLSKTYLETKGRPLYIVSESNMREAVPGDAEKPPETPDDKGAEGVRGAE